MKKIVVTFGGASLIKDLISTPTRRGPTFVRTKVGKIRLGLCPKTPVAGCAGYGLICGGSRKSIRTAHRIAPKVATGVSALSPHPLSRGGKGARMGGQVGTESDALGVLGLAKTVSRKPMVMVSGAGGLHRKGGRSPPPKRGRPGGGRCAAAPYKHRLAHDPGGRRPSGRAFRCVGVLGFTPSRFWERGPRRVVRPGGERRAHRSGEGCP